MIWVNIVVSCHHLLFNSQLINSFAYWAQIVWSKFAHIITQKKNVLLLDSLRRLMGSFYD